MKRKNKLAYKKFFADKSDPHRNPVLVNNSKNPLRLDLFFQYVESKPPKSLSNGIFEIKILPEYNPNYLCGIHTFSQIKELQEYIKYLTEYSGRLRKIIILLPNVFFVDSATAILFSLCIDYLIEKKPSVDLDIRVTKSENCPGNSAYFQSFLHLISSFNDKIAISKYKALKNSFDISLEHKYFYKILLPSENKMELSILESDLYSFLTSLGSDNSFYEKIIAIISELVGNAIEHSQQPTLVFLKKLDAASESKCLYTINVLCFAEKKIFTELSSNYCTDNQICSGRINDAYNYHKKSFDSQYRENHFFITAALQPGITSRSRANSGGIGLPTFVENISDRVSYNDCYVICENEAIFFHNNLLGIKKDSQGVVQEIGLNKTNSFLNDIPDKEIIKDSPIFINGVLYNIILVKNEAEVQDE